MAIDWIKRRAAEARQDRSSERWQIHKQRVIESHSHEFFAALRELMERSVAAFNAEFEGDGRGNLAMKKSLNRFVLSRQNPALTTVDCRLDYATYEVRYRMERATLGRKIKFQQENSLKFDMTGGNKVQLINADSLPMSLDQTTQLLLEPFF